MLVGQATLSASTINTISKSCVVGNSQSISDPAEMEMRHLIFSSQTISSSAILSMAQTLVLPNQSGVLAFFSMEKHFRFEDTYFRNPSRSF